MGLLDDAIREHLELKRRHGADPEEVGRQEREALGEPPPPPEEQEAAAEGEPALDDATTVLPPPTVEHEVPDEVDPPEGEEELPSEGHEADAPGYDEDPWLEEDEQPAEQPVAEEDVLEETPEFLQETPEHDRLWFEQKPPRDFDWDR
jgi:hypothetical protein